MASVNSSSHSATLSTEVAQRIAAPQRGSARAMYRSKLKVFRSWCQSQGLDGIHPTISEIADFFMFLFQEKNLQLLIIQGYRTAVQDYYGLITPDIRSSSILSRLLQSFHRDRPKALRTLPPWDLRVVLQALTAAPF